MALQERRVINKIEILPNGSIQVREADEIYDDAITPSDAVDAVTRPETALDLDDSLTGLEAHVLTGKTIPVSPKIPAVTDVKGRTFHRYVINKNQSIPADVRDFLDNTQ